MPYKIVQGKTNSYNYLVGYVKEPEKEIKCFRISRIKTVRKTCEGAHISKEDITNLEKELLSRAPMFMSGDIIDIKVQFTDKGLEDFRKQIYMRPHDYDIDKENKHLYIFHCTERQAFNYFSKWEETQLLLSHKICVTK